MQQCLSFVKFPINVEKNTLESRYQYLDNEAILDILILVQKVFILGFMQAVKFRQI